MVNFLKKTLILKKKCYNYGGGYIMKKKEALKFVFEKVEVSKE